MDVVFPFFFLGVSLDASCVLKMAGVERERKEERGRQGDGSSGGSSWAQLLAEGPRFYMLALSQSAHDSSSNNWVLARKSKRQPGGNPHIGPVVVAGHFWKKLEKAADFGFPCCVDRG